MFELLEKFLNLMMSRIIVISDQLTRIDAKIDTILEGGGGTTPPPVDPEAFKKWTFERMTGSRQVKFFKVIKKDNGKTGPGDEYGDRWKISNGDTVLELQIPVEWVKTGADDWDRLKYVQHYDGPDFKDGFIKAYLNDGVFRNEGTKFLWDPDNLLGAFFTRITAPFFTRIQRAIQKAKARE